MARITIGIDSIPIALIHENSQYKSLSDFEKSGSKDIAELKGFFGVLGLAVTVKDYDKFNTLYKEALRQAFNENGYESIDLSQRPILCSKDLREYSEGEDILHESFFNKIKSHILKINVFFSSFNAQKIPEVKILSRTRHSQAVHPKILTLRYLNNSFPHICTWKLLEYISRVKANVHLDHFGGKRTRAWDEIEKAKLDLDIHFKGDECNPLIASADILLRCLENRIEKTKSTYDYSGISTNFREIKDKLHVHNINANHYPDITPRDERNIPLRKYIKRPIFFIISPASKEVDVSFFLTKPKGHKLVSKVHEKKGCFKIFAQREDRAILKENDFLVYLDKEGEKTAELIKKASGINVNIIEF